MEKEGNVLVVRSDSEIKIPKFKSVFKRKQSLHNSICQSKNNFFDKEDSSLSEEGQKEIVNLVNQIDGSLVLNMIQYFSQNQIKKKDRSFAILELLNILSQPIDVSYPKNRFIPNKK